MYRFRMAALAAMTACAVSLGAAGTASAAQEPAATDADEDRRRRRAAKGFEGTYTIKRFATRGGKLVAVGTLRARCARTARPRRSSRARAVMPASVAGAGPAGTATASQLPDIPNACQILNLRLGPIDLNLLGLVVRTNQINVRIDGRPGRRQPAGQPAVRDHGPARPDGCARPRPVDQQPRRRAERDPGARADGPRDRRHRRRRTLAPCRPQGAPAVPCGRRGHLLRHPAHGRQAPGQLHRRLPAVRRRPGPRRPVDLLHRRPALDHRRLRPGGQLRERTYDLFALFVAAGLDPERSILFRQSDVTEHTELAWLLSSVIPLGELNRMHQFRDKSVAASGRWSAPGCSSTPC